MTDKPAEEKITKLVVGGGGFLGISMLGAL